MALPALLRFVVSVALYGLAVNLAPVDFVCWTGVFAFALVSELFLDLLI